MTTYRVTLKLRSTLGTPLAADTLWGHIAWGIRYRDGEEALIEWLERYDHQDPPLVISDPLPAGFFPRPQMPPPLAAQQDATQEQAMLFKHLAKIPWIDCDQWQTVATRLSPATLQEALAKTQTPLPLRQMAVTRAAINRLRQSTIQSDGATTLFTEEHLYADFSRSPEFDVWTISPEEPAMVEQWFCDGLAGGYGRDASAGLGWLEVVNVEQANLPSVADANAGVLVAATVPRASDPARGFFRLGVRCGRVGGDFAIDEPTSLSAAGPWQRQKRPVFCLLAGSILFWDGRPPSYVGRTVANVHPQLPSIRHYGMSPVLPCRLDDDIRQHPFLQLTSPYGDFTPEVSS